MSKHTINGFLVWRKWVWDAKHEIVFQHHDTTSCGEHSQSALVGPHSFEVEVPDDFDPTPAMVSTLEEKKRKLRLELAGKLAEIDEQISKLTCLTYEAPEAA